MIRFGARRAFAGLWSDAMLPFLTEAEPGARLCNGSTALMPDR